MQALKSKQPPQPQELERAQDVGKSKLMTQQLGLLLHAQNCLKEEKERKFTMPPSYNGGCYKPHCKTTMKTVLIHMSSCFLDRKQCSRNKGVTGSVLRTYALHTYKAAQATCSARASITQAS